MGQDADPRRLERDVAVFEGGDRHTNTIVLRGADIIVPLSRDLDDDPLQDDEVRLQREDGHFERVVRSSDVDVEPHGDTELLYHFRDVPPGLYRVSVRVAGQWADVIVDLIVRRGGVFCNGERVEQGPAAAPSPATDDEEPEDEEEDIIGGDGFVDED